MSTKLYYISSSIEAENYIYITRHDIWKTDENGEDSRSVLHSKMSICSRPNSITSLLNHKFLGIYYANAYQFLAEIIHRATESY